MTGPLFVIAVCILQLGAAAAYANAGDWKRGVFWVAIVVANIAVTW